MGTPDPFATLHDWPHFLTAGVLVMVRLSGLFVFAPVFNSQGLPPRIKVALVFALTVLLAPVVGFVSGANASLDVPAIVGELGVGLCFGLSLTLLTEALMFAGTLLGLSFSFSLVNLIDPNTRIETAVISQILNWFGILVVLGAGLDRTLLAALIRSFSAVPVGRGVLQASSAVALVSMASGIFLAGLQLAAPVMAAALAIEVTISLISRLAPQLPAMVVSIPLKTMASYAVLLGSLAMWPGWIEHHFTDLLDSAAKLLVKA